jgi:ribose 5-phosphate isomerase B
MKIAIGADPTRLDFKEGLKNYLEAKGHEIIDLSLESQDGPVWSMKIARNVAQAVTGHLAELGIVMCGTGMGVSIAANKNKGVRCAMVESYWAAIQCRRLNNANILAIGADTIGMKLACQIADVFIETEFLDGLPPERKAKLFNEYEQWQHYEKEVFK